MRHVNSLISLSGRTALVTGGAGHIGFAIAEALAEAGAKVALADRDEERLDAAAARLNDAGAEAALPLVTDLLVEDSVRALVPSVSDAFGRLDILVNCAAFVGTSKLAGWAEPFERQTTDAWRQAFEVNVNSVFALVQEAAPLLKANGNGSIVNVSSIYGSYGPDWSLYEGTSMANPAAYGSSKGALVQLTRWLSTTLAPHVRVNTLSPGGVARGQPDTFVSRYEAKTPLKRMAVEEDFKGPALFLASDLSAYVTGQNLYVDGGWGVW